MSTEAEHKIQIVHNEDFLKELNQDKYKDWAITGYFYCAVHSVEYLLARDFKEHSEEHGDRRVKIEKHNDRCSQFKKDYISLYKLSRMARYDCIIPTNNNLYMAEQYYLNIKNAVNT